MNRILRYLFFALLWAGLVAYCVVAGGRARDHRAAQRVERIEVRLTDSTSQERLLSGETVRGWLAKSGITTVGAPAAEVDLAAIEELIARNGFVEGVDASISYDGLLTVRVSQRQPLLRLRLDGYDSYLTGEGYVFTAPRASSVYVPVVTGSYRPLFPSTWCGPVEEYVREQSAAIDLKIEELEREKYPLYRQQLVNRDSVLVARRMYAKKRWFQSKESYERDRQKVREERNAKLRRWRYEARMIQQQIDRLFARQEAERLRQKNLWKSYEDFSKLSTFVNWIEHDEFWRAEIVQITARSSASGAMEVELTPRSGNHTILFGRLEAFDEKFDRLLRFYRGGLYRAGWDRYRTIDVRYAGQVVCTEQSSK